MIPPLGVVSLSPRAFRALGIEEIACVKPVFESTGSTYESHAADGARLAVVAGSTRRVRRDRPPRSRTREPAPGSSDYRVRPIP
jgi:hypothetical protein